MLRFFLLLVVAALRLSLSSQSSLADDGGLARLRERFDEHILPIVSRSCLACHDGVAKEAELGMEMGQVQQLAAGKYHTVCLETTEAVTFNFQDHLASGLSDERAADGTGAAP